MSDKIIIDKNLKKNLQQIALGNIINGGISQTQIKLSQSKNGYHASFAVPAAEESTFRVLLNKQHLEVYRRFRIESETEDGEENLLEMSMLITSFLVPHFIDIERIEATYKEGSLQLFAPFKEGEAPDSKEIPIQPE
jgi:HSP20 family molecular chaperone IbpA